MNIDILQARMGEFFERVSTDYLIEQYEGMGYTFVDTYATWDRKTHDNLIHCIERKPVQIPWYKCLFSSKKAVFKKNLTSEYSGSFFLPNLVP